MTAPRQLHASPLQQALSLTLATAVTALVLAGLLGEAGSGQAERLARQIDASPQAVALLLTAAKS